MNEEMYDIALRNTLVEIKNAYTDINWAFILTNNAKVITSEENTVDPNVAKAASSFQSLAEKTEAVGGLDNLLINGEKSKVYVSSVNDMYLVAGLAKNVDLVYYRTITSAVFPTILKVLDGLTSSTLTPTPLSPPPLVQYSPPITAPSELKFQDEEAAKVEEFTEANEAEESSEAEEPEVQLDYEPSRYQRREEPKEIEEPKDLETIPSQQLIVDKYSGLMVRSDTVQLDADVLKRWSDVLNSQEINEVDIETFGGRTARFKTKVISDSKLEGRGLIRIPDKACQSLEVRRGELVRVKPVTLEESD